MAGSPFDALDAMVSAAVEGAFAQRIIVTPRLGTGGQYSTPAPDPQRPPVEFLGVLSSGPAVDILKGQGAAGGYGGSTMISGQTMTVWISAETVNSIIYPIKRGDLVRIPDDSERDYVVVRAYPSDTGDLELTLNTSEE